MKYRIGILAPTRKNTVDPFDNSTRFVENYSARIKEIGCLPVGLLFPRGNFIEELADLCDAYIITGGSFVESVGINLVHYAIKKNKPLIGICLGMQTMAGYDWVIQRFGKNITYEEIDSCYRVEHEEFYLGYTTNHDEVDPFSMEGLEQSKHDVLIQDKDSFLFDIFKSDVIRMPSLHKQMIKNDYSLQGFKVVATSRDGIIEGIESINAEFVVGVQFHPELEEKNIVLFEELKKHI